MRNKTLLGRCLAAFLCAGLFCNGCGTVADNGSLSENAVSDNDIVNEEDSDKGDFDPSSIRAQDDFYGYVNAEYLMSLEYEYGKPSAGSFDVAEKTVDDKIDKIIDDIVSSEENFKKGTEEYNIKSLYDMYIAEFGDDAVEAKAKQDVYENIENIMSISSIDEYIEYESYYRTRYGVSVFRGIGVEFNYHNPDEYAVYFPQETELCGILLESINENSYNCKSLEDKITESLKITGVSKEEARDIANSAVYLIVDICWATDMDVLKDDNAPARLKFCSYEELSKIFTNISVEKIEELYGIESNPYGGWMILDEGQMKAIDNTFTEENLEELRALLLYSFIKSYGQYIAEDHDSLRNYFPVEDEKNVPEEKVRKEAREYIITACQSELNNLFIREYYSAETDKELRSMCEDIRKGYRQLIYEADWLTESSRKALLNKLENLQFVTGINGEMDIIPSELITDNLYETNLNFSENIHTKSLSNIGKTRDRMEAGMTMQTVNACYNTDNTITITMGIMESPFYNLDADYYTNLGGLGMVIAHEMGHAFDSNCLLWDADGMFNPSWLSDEDQQILEDRNKKTISYYEDYFTVFEVYHVNGEKTLGENYADVGAMECLSLICNKEDEYKKMYESFATIWAELSLESTVLGQIDDDPHSPATIRVNAVLAATDEFYEVYDVKEGDGMYIAPENRIDRW